MQYDIYGQSGNDKIFGPSDAYGVNIYGNDGDDIIDLGDGVYGHYVEGGSGNDKIIGGINDETGDG